MIYITGVKMDHGPGKANSSSGFTLIELMVAMAVFLILVSLSTSVFIQTLRTQRTIDSVTADNESASEALEQMARDIRTGYNFTAPDVNSQGIAHDLVFSSAQENATVGFKLSNQSVARCIDTCQTDSDYKPVTPPGVNISDLSFIPVNLTSGVPRITILMTVSASTSGGTSSNINTYLETTVSARNF